MSVSLNTDTMMRQITELAQRMGLPAVQRVDVDRRLDRLTTDIVIHYQGGYAQAIVIDDEIIATSRIGSDLIMEYVSMNMRQALEQQRGPESERPRWAPEYNGYPSLGNLPWMYPTGDAIMRDALEYGAYMIKERPLLTAPREKITIMLITLDPWQFVDERARWAND